jgi:hypothetical protein
MGQEQQGPVEQAPAAQEQQDPLAAVRQLQDGVFVQRLALAVLQAWLPVQQWRQDHACKLQRLVPAVLSVGSGFPMADTAGQQQAGATAEEVVLAAKAEAAAGRVEAAGEQLLGLAELGASSAGRVIRKEVVQGPGQGCVDVCCAVLAAWKLGHPRWLEALHDAVLAAVRAS